MKKLLICLALAFSLVTLGACGKNESAKPTSSTNNHQSKGQGQVTLILKTEKESKKKSVEFKKGDTVLDVLKEIGSIGTGNAATALSKVLSKLHL